MDLSSGSKSAVVPGTSASSKSPRKKRSEPHTAPANTPSPETIASSVSTPRTSYEANSKFSTSVTSDT